MIVTDTAEIQQDATKLSVFKRSLVASVSEKLNCPQSWIAVDLVFPQRRRLAQLRELAPGAVNVTYTLTVPQDRAAAEPEPEVVAAQLTVLSASDASVFIRDAATASVIPVEFEIDIISAPTLQVAGSEPIPYNGTSSRPRGGSADNGCVQAAFGVPRLLALAVVVKVAF